MGIEATAFAQFHFACFALLWAAFRIVIYELHITVFVVCVCHWQRTPVSTLRRQSVYRAGRYGFSLDEQQAALLSLSAIADCVQLPPPPSSSLSTALSPQQAAAAAAALSSTFVYGSQNSVLPAYTPIQVREVARNSHSEYLASILWSSTVTRETANLHRCYRWVQTHRTDCDTEAGIKIYKHLLAVERNRCRLAVVGHVTTIVIMCFASKFLPC